jgi:hypothetical protein
MATFKLSNERKGSGRCVGGAARGLEGSVVEHDKVWHGCGAGPEVPGCAEVPNFSRRVQKVCTPGNSPRRIPESHVFELFEARTRNLYAGEFPTEDSRKLATSGNGCAGRERRLSFKRQTKNEVQAASELGAEVYSAWQNEMGRDVLHALIFLRKSPLDGGSRAD